MPPFSARLDLSSNAGARASRCGAATTLFVALHRSQGSFTALYELVGSPAFLLGLCICILGALSRSGFGRCANRDRQYYDRRSRPRASLRGDPETGVTAGIIALLVKLVLAGGLGMVLDSRRRTLAGCNCAAR